MSIVDRSTLNKTEYYSERTLSDGTKKFYKSRTYTPVRSKNFQFLCDLLKKYEYAEHIQNGLLVKTKDDIVKKNVQVFLYADKIEIKKQMSIKINELLNDKKFMDYAKKYDTGIHEMIMDIKKFVSDFEKAYNE